MMANKEHFNLVEEPWIKVIDQVGRNRLLSLQEVFTDAANIRDLAGEMRSQDLAILRFLLAILTTIYSRVDFDGQPYDWIDEPEDFDRDDLVDTWANIWNAGNFSHAVNDYLQEHCDDFDLLSKHHPFYQVTKEQYDNYVPANKAIAKGKGTVAIKQMDRTISESNNSPAIFSPKDKIDENKIDLPTFTRWLITYQNFTGVTDKTKVVSDEKFSASNGWLYGIDPVFFHGKNLFQTLLLNLKMQNFDDDEYISQHPVWEEKIDHYISHRLANGFPNNVSELYTIWSRIIHVEWNNGQPTVFSACLPKTPNEGSFKVEPMTTWKKDKQGNIKPEVKWIKSLGKAMWRNFGQYVSISADANDQSYKPGVVRWVNELKNNYHLISQNQMLNLATIGMVSDGNATSQSPAAEVTDNLQIEAGVLFDKENSNQAYWPATINSAIDVTQAVADSYWKFAKQLGDLRGLLNSSDFATDQSKQFYERLNEPFYKWLASLSSEDERSDEYAKWLKQLKALALLQGRLLFNSASPSDVKGKINSDTGKITNIFTIYRIYTGRVFHKLSI